MEGVDDFAAIVIGQPDIEKEMDVGLGGVDIGDEGVDGGGGVVE